METGNSNVDNNGIPLPPNANRPPTQRMTRSMSSGGMPGGSGQLPATMTPSSGTMLLDSNPQGSSTMMLSISDLNIIIDTAVTSAVRNLQSALADKAPVSAAAHPMPTLRQTKEADKIKISDLPELTSYDDWRIRTVNAAIAASANSKGAKAFMAEVSQEADISETPEEFESLDSKLKSALLDAMKTITPTNMRIMGRYRLTPDVNGRTLLKIIDTDYGRNDATLNAKRATQLTNLTCKHYSELNGFLANWVSLSGMIAGTKQEMDKQTMKEMLVQKLSGVREVAATIAKYEDENRENYDELLQNLLHKEDKNRFWGEGSTPFQAQAVKLVKTVKPDRARDVSGACSYCVKRRRDPKKLVRHTDKQCWSNPENTSETKGPNKYMALKGSQERAPKSKAENADSRPSPPTNGEKVLAARIANDPGMMSEIITELQKSKTDDTILKPRIAVVKEKSSMATTIDSGASFSVVASDYPPGDILKRVPLHSPVELECVGGIVQAHEHLTVHHKNLGPFEAYSVTGTAPVVSLGQLVKRGFTFMWNPASFDTPLLTRPDGGRIALRVENNTPVLNEDDGAQCERPKSIKACMAKVHEHNNIHFPTNRDCKICQMAKMKRKPAKRVSEERRHVAQDPLGRVSIDLVEATCKDIYGNWYLFTWRDDFSGMVAVRPQKSKTAAETLKSFQSIAAEMGLPRIIRSDQGKEFGGEFEKFVLENLIQQEFGIPNRPQSDGRHERMHLEMNQAIRVLLLQAGLPTTFWSHAAEYWTKVICHFKTNKQFDEGESNPCEKFRKAKCNCYDKIFETYGYWPNFGSEAIYLDDGDRAGRKYDSKGKMGVLTDIASHMSLIVSDLDDLAKNPTFRVVETRDVKIDNASFPARALGLRSGSDEVFYYVLTNSQEITNKPCPSCKQIVKEDEPTCAKCTNETSYQPHTRDTTCKFGRCRCARRVLTRWMSENLDKNRKKIMEEEEQEDDDSSSSEQTLYPVTNEEIQTKLIEVPEETVPIQEEAEASNSNEDEVSVTTQKVLMTKSLDESMIIMTDNGRAALEKELQNMMKYRVWDPNEVVEMQEVIDQTAKFVPVKVIFGLKNAELPPSEQIVKARIVAQGCNVKDSNGRRVTDKDFPYEAPAALSSFRLALWAASNTHMSMAVADVQGAYLHAPLLGPPVFLQLPKSIRPESWQRFKNPVVRARKALYGLSRSGADFAKYARECLEGLGWTQSSVDPSLYFKNGGILVLYVDDMCVVAPNYIMEKEMTNLRTVFQLDKISYVNEYSTKPTRYLGMNIHRARKSIVIESAAYIKAVVERYKLAVNKEELRRSKTPFVDPASITIGEITTPGEMCTRAAEFVGMIQWIARTTRPEISYVACLLGQMVSEWTVYADRCLARLMQYLSATDPRVLEYHMKERLDTDIIKFKIYCDASFNSQRINAKGISGFACYISSKGYDELVHWSSKKQKTTATSSTEAELIALVHAYKKVMIPMEVFINESTAETSQPDAEIIVDSEPAIKAIKQGRSQEMLHLSRTHGVNLEFLNEQLVSHDWRKLVQVEGKENPADLMTKAVQPVDFFKHVKRFSDAISNNYLI